MTVENTRIHADTEETGERISEEEKEQAAYALGELVRSPSAPDASIMPSCDVEAVRPVFELGWAMGVRHGNTGPALAGVPVDRGTVARAFVLLLSERLAGCLARDVHAAGPVVWQRVRYHGSLLRSRHGLYWIGAVHEYALACGATELRYDLYEIRAEHLVTVVSRVRRQSLTPLPEYRAGV
ncbi:hypothetical protein [Streptomyces sp. NPDC093094]|uniref:hypothetical protein n=1 Tax=Streptomyces sp. NPDC093094 TaxID=3366026 RepID=UPI0038150603